MVAASLKKTLFTLAKNGAAQKLASRSNSHLSYQQTLAYAPATQLTLLDNKLRVASEDNGRSTTTLGLYLELGSRDETPDNSGIGGLFANLALEGTTNRSAADLRKQLRDLGTKLEVSRGREITSLTATCANENVPAVMQILSGIVQHSKFDEASIEKQKGVMLNKLENAEKTDVAAVMSDYLHSVAFQDTPLALSPMGNTQGIKNVTAANLADYRSNLVTSERMVLAAAGGVPHDKIAELAAKNFTDCDGNRSYARDREFCRFTSAGVRVRDDEMPTAHLMYAYQAAPVASEDYLVLRLAATMYGSWDATQNGYHSGDRLRDMMTNCNIAHTYQSVHIGYSDTGLYGWYGTCKRSNVKDVTETLGGHLRDQSGYISDKDLERGKHQLKMAILLGLENNSTVVNDIATNMIYNGKRLTPLQLEAAINDITVAQLMSTVEKYSLKMPVAASGLGPIEGMLEVNVYNECLNIFSLL